MKQIEAELPILADNCKGEEVYAGSKIGNAFDPKQLTFFTGGKVWAK